MSTSLVASDEEMPTIEPIICQTNELSLSYDIRIGWISAGSMSAKVCMNGDEYGMRGNLRTRGPFERFLRWRGQFAADGAFESSIPQTYKYVVVEENLNKNKKKVVYMDQSGATVYASGKETRHVDAPAGADIMSSLLLSEMCRNTLVVHDGEEPYDINLYDIATGRRITQGSNHFNGSTELCRYKLVYNKTGRTRRVDVWLGQVDERLVPVRIRVRVPLLPDALFKLRADDTSG